MHPIPIQTIAYVITIFNNPVSVPTVDKINKATVIIAKPVGIRIREPILSYNLPPISDTHPLHNVAGSNTKAAKKVVVFKAP